MRILLLNNPPLKLGPNVYSLYLIFFEQTHSRRLKHTELAFLSWFRGEKAAIPKWKFCRHVQIHMTVFLLLNTNKDIF